MSRLFRGSCRDQVVVLNESKLVRNFLSRAVFGWVDSQFELAHFPLPESNPGPSGRGAELRRARRPRLRRALSIPFDLFLIFRF
jgi:hypothetical protein